MRASPSNVATFSWRTDAGLKTVIPIDGVRRVLPNPYILCHDVVVRTVVFFVGLFVCLIICLFVCLFDCLFDYLFNCLCVCLFV